MIMWEGPLPIIPPGGFFRMKRGKKYQEAVKRFIKYAVERLKKIE